MVEIKTNNKQKKNIHFGIFRILLNELLCAYWFPTHSFPNAD